MSTTEAATSLITPKEIDGIIPAIVRRAQEITIEDHSDYEEAAHALKWIAGQKKKFLDWFEPHVTRARESWKELVADRDGRIGPADEARKIIEGKMSIWEREQERLRREEEDRLRAEAKRLADEAALREAAALEASGDKELAAVVLEQAASAPAPVVVVESRPLAVAGIAKAREIWKFRIVNDSLIPREYLIPNESAIGAVVRAQKGKCAIPGIEVYREDGARAVRV